MKYAAVAIAAAAVALLPFGLSGYHQGLAVYVAIYFIAILGLNILRVLTA